MLLLCVFYIYKIDMIKMRYKDCCTYSKRKLPFVELPLHKNICLNQILVNSTIKSVIEISRFLFDLSPSHHVTIGLKGYMSPKTVYNFKKNVLIPQPSVFTHINFST